MFPLFFSIFLGLTTSTNAASGIYGTINFQGKIVNKSDGTNLIAGSPTCVVSGSSNDTCDFRLQVYDGADPQTANLLWQETYPNYEIGEADGVFNFQLGLCDGSSVNWNGCESGTGVDFDTDSLYAILRFDDDGDADFTEDYFVKRMNAVPYALNAAEWDGVDLDATDPEIKSRTTNDDLKLSANATGALTLQSSGTGNIQFFSGSNTINSSGNLTLAGSISATGANYSGLTASRLMATDGSKNLTSVSALTSWIAGTTNEVSVADDGDGTVTLSLPDTVYLGSSGKLGRDADNLFDFTTDNQITGRVGGADEIRLTASALYPVTDKGLDLGTSSNYWNALYIDGGTIYFDDTTDATLGFDSVNDYFSFNPNGEGAAEMVIEAGGNVGIGTTTPDNLLSLNKVSGDVILDFDLADADKWVIGHDDSSGNFEINSGNAFADASDLELTSSGNLNILGDLTVSGGEIYITPISTSSSTTEGTIYYDTEDDNLYVYADGGWVDLTAGGGTGLWTADGGGTFSYLTDTADDLVLGATTIAAGSLYFDTDAGNLYLGTNESLDAGITFYSSGAGETDPTIVTNSSGDLDIAASSGVLTLSGDSTQDIIAIIDADTSFDITADAAPGSDFVKIRNSGYGLATTSADALSIAYVQSTDATAISGAGIDITVTPSSDASDTIYGINLNNITGTSSTERAINIGTGWDFGIFASSPIGLSTSGYINWGTTAGDSGYGFRESSGNIQYKDSGGSWIDINAIGGTGYWQNSSSVINITNPAYDLAVGGSTLAASMFGIDEDAGNFYFGYDNSANPTFLFEATDSDAGSFGFNTNDSFYFTGAKVGIGKTDPSFELDVEGDLQVGGGELYITPISSSASTTEGTLYYDTEDDNLYVYANGEWVDLTVQGGGSSYFQLSSNVVNPNLATYDFSVGGTTTTESMFGIDESSGDFYFGDVSESVDPTLNFEANDGDLGVFGFNTSDSFYFTGANVGIGTTSPTAELSVLGSITGGQAESLATNNFTFGNGGTAGELDESFPMKLSNGANSSVYSVAAQSDGKIIIGGSFTSYNGTGRNRVASLNSDGSLDTSFNPGTGASSTVRSVAVQSDGKIIIGGNFTSYNGTGRNYIARLNSDGSLDTSFDPGTGADGHVYSVAVQSDGKIIIGGGFTSYNGTGRNYIARLNSNGSLDTSFNPGTGASSYVYSVAVQSDGKIIIGGGFTSYNGTSRNYIARVNSNGSLDTSFDPGTGASAYVQSVAVQSDGKIIIGGGFTSYNGTGRNRVARVNSNGSLDTSFDPGTGANSAIKSVAVQSDGKIIIGGDFSSYDGTGRIFIARVNSDGSLDTSFDPGTGTNSSVKSVAVQSDGKIIIGGDFTSYNGTSRGFIARILPGTLSNPYADSFMAGFGSANLLLDSSKLSLQGVNMGIGVDTPTSKLQIRGDTTDTLSSALHVTNLGDQSLFFVRNDGSVGIGTTSPDNLLSLNEASGDVILDFDIADADKWVLGVDSSDSEKFEINSGSAFGDASNLELDSSGNLVIAGDFTVTGGDIIGIGGASVDLGEMVSGDISFLANDTDDYIYLNTTTNVAGLFWAGTGAGSAPGIYTNGTELGYKDEADSWVSFDSLVNATTYMQLSTNVVNPTQATYDFAVGGTTTTESMFGIDESSGDFYFGDVSESVDPTLNFEANDGDLGVFGFNTSDSFYFTGANVGIGTTAPNDLLELLSTTDAQLRLAYDGSNYSAMQVASDGGLTWSMLGTDADLNIDFSGATDGDFSINNDDLFIDTTTGYVGIGTTDPTSKLSIGGSTSVISNDTGDMTISSAGDIILSPTSSVGIGTTDPNQKLEVNGRIRMGTWTADGDTAVYKDDATGDIGIQTSDVRLKKNLTPITGALGKISLLQGFTYNTLDEEDGDKKRLGVIAQDLIAAGLPEATFSFYMEGSETEYFGVHYEKLTALLIEGVKEQQGEIDDIETEMDTLSEMVVDGATASGDIDIEQLAANVTLLANNLTILTTQTTNHAAQLALLGSYLDENGLNIASANGFMNYDKVASLLEIRGDEMQLKMSNMAGKSSVLGVNSEGDLVINAGEGKVIFESEPILSEDGRHQRTITLSPQYANSVYTSFYGEGKDENTKGEFSVDIEQDAENEQRTFVQWVSTEEEMNYKTIAVRVTLPDDFDEWEEEAINIDFQTASKDTEKNLVETYIYQSTDLDNQVDSDIETKVAELEGEWGSYISFDGLTLDEEDLANSKTSWNKAKQTAILYIRVGSSSDVDNPEGYKVKLGDIRLNYLSKY